MDAKLVFMKAGMKNPFSIPLEAIETREKVAFRAAFSFVQIGKIVLYDFCV